MIDSGLIGGISPEYPDVFQGAVGMPSEPPDTGVPAESLIKQALSPREDLRRLWQSKKVTCPAATTPEPMERTRRLSGKREANSGYLCGAHLLYSLRSTTSLYPPKQQPECKTYRSIAPPGRIWEVSVPGNGVSAPRRPHQPLADGSRYRFVIGLGAQSERTDGCRTLKAPVHSVVSVEPYEPEQAIKPDSAEQVSNFCLLVSGGRHSCLSDEDRFVGQCAHVSNRRPEN